ncbi:hypothetical protein [Vibrio barjaei]|uniref:hypothetical protein n=1 Tax=Vibrio barjaei TaxID=1676683 RepID=UPI00228378C0|nr:hypothetical protein [Vibrio barjaei]MCY9872288.1 hypothetical protein [Vibrio barjaei]
MKQAVRKVIVAESNLFENFEVNQTNLKRVMSKTPRPIEVPPSVTEPVVSELEILLFPEKYETEYQSLIKRMEKSEISFSYEPKHILKIQEAFIQDLEQVLLEGHSNKDLYPDFLNWVFTDSGTEFSFDSCSYYVWGIKADRVRPLIAKLIMSDETDTVRGHHFRKFAEKHGKVLMRMIMRENYL